MPKKILIISYTFPPSNKIGGRRWVKFAKYFVKDGLDVQVITSKNIPENGWMKDLEYIKSNIHEISFKYPFYLGINPKSLGQKIMYRLHLIWSKINTNLNYYDKSVHGESELTKCAISYINKGYNNIVVTVAPFHLATHISKIVSKYPECNFIVDYRDPWIDNKTSYGYDLLSESRKLNEQKAEEKVVNSFNHVVTVSSKITNDLKERYFNIDADFHTIPNGYDTDDISNSLVSLNKDDKIRLVFSGTLYKESEKYFNLLLSWLSDIKSHNIQLFNKIVVNIYGFSNITNTSLENVYFNGLVSNAQINNEIQKSDGCLLFLTDDINYSFSTKFCEYISYEKPIIVFSNDGYTSKYIVENKIGHSLSFKNNFNDFSKILNSIKDNELNYYSSFSKDSFDLTYLSQKYLELFK
jgi:glycosyltransferase involved in cell wall biosynthesis